MELPQEFQDKMIALLGEEEFARYEETLSQGRAYGLRANGLKLSAETLRLFLRDAVLLRDPVPWCASGTYFQAEEGRMPGRLSYYLAGLYYIQEPSAMFPAEVAAAEPGEWVLDLCAAPGGKSTALAAALQGKGLLVSNDINAQRANTLVYNLELSGAGNCLITNESPAALAKRFPHCFDKILIDAPCSGEGMFRKDDEAVRSWGNFKNETCAAMQRDILASADALLKPGGKLIYSTCTFDLRENEGMMAEFLASHPDYELLPVPKVGGIANGFAVNGDETFCCCARLWPHRVSGEGHFTALLRKKESSDPDADGRKALYAEKKSKSYRLFEEPPAELARFYKENMRVPLPENLYYYGIGENLFAAPFEPLPIDRLKVLRMGIHVGELSHGKLRPTQSFVMHCAHDAFLRNADFAFDADEIRRYVRGESLNVPDCADGITAVRVQGGESAYILGLGEVRSGVLKNLYPKGWRRML